MVCNLCFCFVLSSLWLCVVQDCFFVSSFFWLRASKLLGVALRWHCGSLWMGLWCGHAVLPFPNFDLVFLFHLLGQVVLALMTFFELSLLSLLFFFSSLSPGSVWSWCDCYLQVTWVSWTFCWGLFPLDFQCFAGSSEWFAIYVSVLSCLLFGCALFRTVFL